MCAAVTAHLNSRISHVYVFAMKCVWLSSCVVEFVHVCHWIRANSISPNEITRAFHNIINESSGNPKYILQKRPVILRSILIVATP